MHIQVNAFQNHSEVFDLLQCRMSAHSDSYGFVLSDNYLYWADLFEHWNTNKDLIRGDNTFVDNIVEFSNGKTTTITFSKSSNESLNNLIARLYATSDVDNIEIITVS